MLFSPMVFAMKCDFLVPFIPLPPKPTRTAIPSEPPIVSHFYEVGLGQNVFLSPSQNVKLSIMAQSYKGKGSQDNEH